MDESYQRIVVDAMNLAHRYWWVHQASVTADGRDNSLEVGFMSGLLPLQSRYPSAEFILAWDGRPARQLALAPGYKASRAASHADRPADWHARCDRLRQVLALVLPTLYDPDDEADVEITRLVKCGVNARTLIVSGDRDLLALLSDHVDVLQPGRTARLFRTEDFNQEYGFPPAGLALFRALTGDRSDNIKGLPYFPRQIASGLAARFRTAESLYRELTMSSSDALQGLSKSQREKLVNGEEQVQANERLLDLFSIDGKPHLRQPAGDTQSLAELLRETGMAELADAMRWDPAAGLSWASFSVGLHRIAHESQSQSSTELEKLPSEESWPSDGDSPPRLVLPESWENRLEKARLRREQQIQPHRTVPRSPSFYAGKLTFVEDDSGAQALVELASQLPLSAIGFDWEFRYSRPEVFIKKVKGKEHFWYDPRSIAPLLLAVTLVEATTGDDYRLLSFVVDCRRREVAAALAPLFMLPVKFLTHYAPAELFCQWQLDLPEPPQVWDTWAAERAFLLGIHHARYTNDRPKSEADEVEAKEEAEQDAEFGCSLSMSCLRRGVPYPFAGDKARLQASFLTHPDDQPFTQEQIEYCSADAVAVARLYPLQTQIAVRQSCLEHLIQIEMPWAVTNARTIWNGVRVSPELSQQLRNACLRHQETLGSQLRSMGIENANSHPQLHTFFEQAGLLDLFTKGDGHSFDDDHLEPVEDRHPSIPLIRALRKAKRLLTDKAFTGELVGADGRLHPEHRQLGAESGRNTMRNPNIGGIGRSLRPVVVPDDGFAIGEVDLSQIEVGIAAAVYGDPELIRMFNGRDVYTVMAKQYYAAELPAGAAGLPDKVFKKKYRDLRDRMKIFTLATIYNITPFGLSVQLGISVPEAERARNRFLAMFPILDRALRQASEFGAIRGFAYLCSGLRRWRAHQGSPSSWEINWMRNTPVQGSAGVVFKAAGNRLHRRYQHYGAKLILPMHDAFVFEAPQHQLQTVAKITAEEMRGAVQTYFPELDPQVDINIDHPHCWNKDGKFRSLALWMVHPEHARRYL
jgi:DNA polymerase I